MPAQLAYWKIRGLAQPIRLLLEYTGTEYEEKRYECGPAPDYDRSEWLDVKHSFGLDFPNLPCYIDGDVKLTQSNAILRYIARKNNLCGETEEERVRVDLMDYQCMDFRTGMSRLAYNPKFEELRPGYVKDVYNSIKQISQFLGSNKWIAGDKITYVDFLTYELLDQHRILEPTLLDDFQNLKDFLARFEALPKIAAYMKSDRFMSHPINNKMAKFGAE
ncbi:glutathione S-transferase Mu 1-like [Branchiostoma lanceolatum]|uniref:glutathione S-transferase Mu 1-like n=1 Tax=Branchiostoma lanceolatum TaxID=7740 RepID=UPI00345514C3